jgi:hypothetical protein
MDLTGWGDSGGDMSRTYAQGNLRAALCAAALCMAPAAHAEVTPVLWAWERPEDFRFATGVEAAVQAGFVEIGGQTVVGRGRRFPLKAVGADVSTAVVHIQIDHGQPLAWTTALRARTAAKVLAFARAGSPRRVQIDFEVRRSERQVLLDLLADVRAGLPAGVPLSMTALASWCETETWLASAPVDEIVPMLFRMGPGGAAIRAKLAAGGDFTNQKCRSAYAISLDAPLKRAPDGRRVYLFSPRPWTAGDFDTVMERVSQWTDVQP